MKRLKNETEVRARLDDDTILEELIKETERKRPGWKASLGPKAKGALVRRETLRNGSGG